jgi:ABC-type proline/glycine betaine transport system permease subunit
MSMNNEPAILDDNIDMASSPEISSVRKQFDVITGDIKTLFNSELDYYKVRLSYSKTVAKWTGIYLLISFCALFGGVVASIVGALLIATSFWGPVWGTLAVIAASLVITILFALMARSKSKQFSFPEIDKGVSSE